MSGLCKYCLEDSKESNYPLIYPCKCSDGVHANCLAIWIIVRPPNHDRTKCEICTTSYIGIVIKPPSPPPPPPQQLVDDNDEVIDIEENDDQIESRNSITIDFICCECGCCEGMSYVFSTVFGLVATIIAFFPRYHYTSNLQLISATFFVGCSTLFLLGMTLTTIRHYQKCVNRRVHIRN